MIILVLRTDGPVAEMGVFNNTKQMAYEVWEAHLKLAETIHLKMKEISAAADISLEDLGGIVVFHGPGSFTGLRIGISVANALATSLEIPVVGSGGDDWVRSGIVLLQHGKNDRIVQPEYGAAVRTTTQKK